MYVILEYYSVWFCFTLHEFLHLTLSDHIMNAIRRINDVETNKLKLKHTIYYFPIKFPLETAISSELQLTGSRLLPSGPLGCTKVYMLLLCFEKYGPPLIVYSKQ